MCDNCIHKAVCSIYRATGGVKNCEHFIFNLGKNPNRQRGFWEDVDTSYYDVGRSWKLIQHTTYRCSRCARGSIIKTNYCPACGADMRGGSDG